MNNNLKNQQGGFLQIIIAIILLLVIMNYLGITFSGLLNWVAALFRGAL